MLDPAQKELIRKRAYVPEHLIDYVQAISRAEPYLQDSHLCFLKKDHLIFIGYPLAKGPSMEMALNSARDRFKPASVAILAPSIRLPGVDPASLGRDDYYILDLPLGSLAPKVANMVRRAEQETASGQGMFGQEHLCLIEDFIARRLLNKDQVKIYRGITDYLARSPSAIVLEARKNGDLKAFNIVDLSSKSCAFFMFSFRNQDNPQPGVSDLLFKNMADLAWERRKKTLNLGLGINSGIRRFKEKWGGYPAWPQESIFLDRAKKTTMEEIVDLLRPR